MPTPQEAMFSEALAAVHAGDRARARDLFTRLLKVRQDNADYWVWMSAVVETAKERAYCLKEALRLDPDHPAAQRGLLILGAVPVDSNLAVPVDVQRRSWQGSIRLPGGEDDLPKHRITNLQISIIGVTFLVVAGLVMYALFGAQNAFQRRAVRPILIIPTGETASASSPVTPSAAPAVSTTPDSLAAGLAATYTPTPLYVNTPHSASEAYSIGLRAYQRGEWQKAQEFLLQVVELEPEAADLHYYIGEAYRQQGQYSKAIQAYGDAIEHNERFAPAYLGRALASRALNPKTLDAVEEDLQAAVQRDPGMVEPYLALASLRIEEENPMAALGLLEKAADLAPDSPLVSLYRAEAYLSTGDLDKSLEHALRAKELDVTLLPAYRMIGQALQAAGDYEGSLASLETYLQYAPDDTHAWLLIASAQLSLGDRMAARQSLDRALEQDGRQLEPLLVRGNLLLEEDEAEQALKDYELAEKIDPESFPAAMGTARALMALGYPGDAYTQIERSKILAVEAAQKAEWQFWRARSLDELGEIAIALRDYQAVVEQPAGAIDENWVKYARERIGVLKEKTPTARPVTATPSVTATHTRQPTRTVAPTATAQPGATRTP